MTDTSREYILMCEKAVEIQEKRMAKSGDIYRIYIIEEYNIHKDSCASGNLVRVQWSEGLHLSTDVEWFREIRKGFILFNFVGQQVTERINKATWLPDQRQLQEMFNNVTHHTHLIANLYHEITSDFNYWKMFDSMEQLLFAFVMHEKFNKRWTGSDWAVIK